MMEERHFKFSFEPEQLGIVKILQMTIDMLNQRRGGP